MKTVEPKGSGGSNPPCSGYMILRKLFRPALITVAVLFAGFLFLRFLPYPALQMFLARDFSTRFYDRNGVLLQITAVDGGIRREYAAFDEIPAELRDVFVYSEDKRFFFHHGADLAAAARAFIQNIRQKKIVSGASTITMQLARIIEGGSRRGMASKIAEAFDAARLEARFSKKQILHLYLNAIPFGRRTEGVASAAREFFSKSLADLSPAEIALLAVIPRRPALYDPHEHPGESAEAAARLAGRFTKSRRFAARNLEAAALTRETIDFAVRNARRFVYPFEAPHFIRYMAGVLKAGNKQGVFSARLSIDSALQHRAEAAIFGNVERFASTRLTNGAALVIDNRTGEILCWAGSADFFNEEHAGQVDGVLALNQPGSSMKPFLYALALERGFLPTDVFADVPKNYGDSELYIPQNFNNRFNGPVLFRTALASSLNIPAVELLYRLGIDDYTKLLYRLKFDSVRESVSRAGLGLALGNAPVSLFELVRAFSVFPNDGALLDISGVLGAEPLGRGVAEDSKGGRSEGGVPPVQVFDADTARIICSMLSDRGPRVLAFGTATNFDTPFPSMFKTGTANQYQSIVALGATPLYTAGVWMGNFTGETVIGRTGSSVPAAIVRELLVFLQGRTAVPFKSPDNWTLQPVCALSGMRLSAACIAAMEEWKKTDSGGMTADEPECGWHRADGSVVYPAEYQAWFLSSVRNGALDYHSAPLEVINPRDGFVFFAHTGSGKPEIPVEVTGGSAHELVVDYDGNGWTVERPFVFFLPQERGRHRLIVRCGEEEAAVYFTVE